MKIVGADAIMKRLSPTWLPSSGAILQIGLTSVLRCALFVSVASSMPHTAMGRDYRVSLSGQQMSPNGSYGFSFQAVTGRTYPIEVSLDLLRWDPLTNVVGQGGLLWVQDNNTSSFQQRFYHIGMHPMPVTNMIFIAPGSFVMGSPGSIPGSEPAGRLCVLD
jgi:hypothetical protein